MSRVAIRRTLRLGIGLCMLGVGVADAADLRHVRRHRIARTPHHFVYPTPADARSAQFPGYFAGTFETGILGPATADPYERPAYGYDGDGYLGPGFINPNR